MSKLIVEMEMPKCCWECACCDSEYRYCAARKKPLDDLNNRPSWCPIVGVLPEEHGDLIDKKRAIFELCEGTIPKKYADFIRRVLTSENLTPTVISAERKDDGTTAD